MLDQLGAVNPGDQNGRHERLVNLFHQINSVLTLGPNDNAIWMH